MLRYPSSEIKITSKDLANAEEIQRQYLKKKRQRETDNQKLQQQKQQQQQQDQQQDQDQDQPPSHDLSSSSFTYESPERLDASIIQEEISIVTSNRTNTVGSSSDQQQQQQQRQGTKRSAEDAEPSERKLSFQGQHAKTSRQH